MPFYKNEILRDLNTHKYFSIDECLKDYKNNIQIWLLRLIDNETKDFRKQGIYSTDQSVIKKFINEYDKKGNYIVSNWFFAYNFHNSPESGYIWIFHNHGERILT